MYLEDKIAEGLHRAPMRGQQVGIELEYEKYNGRNGHNAPKLWNIIPDGSLRDNGIEFVSCVLGRRDLTAAFAEAATLIELTRVKATPRCGIHVHLNVGPYSWGQLWGLSILYTLLEPSIFKAYAPDRQDSHFCVPTFCNNVLQKTMMDDITRLRGPDRMKNERRYDDFGDMLPEVNRVKQLCQVDLLRANKYTAMNYSRLHDLCTVEMRHLPAYTDMKIVRKWVEFLLRMQRVSNRMGHEPQVVLDKYNEVGLKGLCEMVGLDMQEIDPMDQEDAEDAATFMVGYKEPVWQSLNWEVA